MTRRFFGAVAALLISAAVPAEAQIIQAIRLDGPSPRVDGRLTEPVWSSAPAIDRLTQKEPDEGAPAIERTEVRFAYDDDALYVGARMFSADPKAIRALVTRRDREGSSEMIAITLDTYRDRRTAYTFAVTPAGVRLDIYHPSDSDDGDSGYDPVWEARARIDSLGWAAEMRIPFAQLRFSPKEEQEWGMNVLRFVPVRNEESYWMLIRREETGWASRMGTLTGIRGIRPSHRVELLPYVAANTRVQQVDEPGNPFLHRSESYARAGGDLKMGLGPNLTLDVTLNPDFGQVEADPAEVNLTAYETFFEERRPFFTEGASLFARRDLFYSRRIGAPPPGRPNADFAEERDNSTILGAAKLTGRLVSGLSVAALAALTDRERVRTFDAASGTFGSAIVAPRTGYAVAAAQQEFGVDASTLGGMVTLVQRDFASGSPLTSLLTQSALSGIVDGRRRWQRGKYDLNFWLGFSHIQGDSAAILRQQLSSRRYWQRPDDFRVDSSLRSMTGTLYGIGHSKMGGQHWLWDIDFYGESPAFEPNDIGAYGTADNRATFTSLRWRETQPSRYFRSYQLGVAWENGWSYDWLKRDETNILSANVVLPNFWEFDSDWYHSRRALSDRLTRGGPVMGTPSGYGGAMDLEGREGSRTGWSVEVRGDRNELGGWETSAEFSLSLRPGDRWEVSIDPEYQRERDMRQFITTEAGGRPETFDTRYIFSAVDVSEVRAGIRVNYTFTPNLTLETFAEPFASSGRFHSFGELLRPREQSLLTYGTAGTTIVRNTDGSYRVTDGATSFDIDNEDFNVRSFRSNVVLRWEWRPGSTAFLVWQQDRSADRVTGVARPGDLWSSLNAPGNNFLAVKVSYWLSK